MGLLEEVFSFFRCNTMTLNDTWMILLIFADSYKSTHPVYSPNITDLSE